MITENNNDLNIKRTKVRGHFKHTQLGKQIWVSPHYRILIKHDGSPTFKRKYLIELRPTSE